jgi:hypothetical protein
MEYLRKTIQYFRIDIYPDLIEIVTFRLKTNKIFLIQSIIMEDFPAYMALTVACFTSLTPGLISEHERH